MTKYLISNNYSTLCALENVRDFLKLLVLDFFSHLLFLFRNVQLLVLKLNYNNALHLPIAFKSYNTSVQMRSNFIIIIILHHLHNWSKLRYLNIRSSRHMKVTKKTTKWSQNSKSWGKSSSTNYDRVKVQFLTSCM